MVPRVHAPTVAVPNKVDEVTGSSWVKDAVLTAAGKHIAVDADARNALKVKQAEPGWKAAGRIGVKAAMASRQRQLVRRPPWRHTQYRRPGCGFLGSITPPFDSRRRPGTVALSPPTERERGSQPVGLAYRSDRRLAGRTPTCPPARPGDADTFERTDHRRGLLPGPRAALGHLGH